MAGLQAHAVVLEHEASALDGYECLTGPQISALKPEKAQNLAGVPQALTITLRQSGILRSEYDFRGLSLRKGNRQKGGFCGAVERCQRRRARAEAIMLRRRARALNKMIAQQVSRPGERYRPSFAGIMPPDPAAGRVSYA